MDPRGNIYQDEPGKIPAEDSARLDGYLKARSEADREGHEAAVRHKIFAAVTEADDLLRELWFHLEAVLPGRDGNYYRAEIRRVRGLLAEWRLESD